MTQSDHLQPAPSGPFDELDNRLAAIQPPSDAIVQARAMAKLDKLTHPKELRRIGDIGAAEAVEKTIEHLQHRLFERASWHLAKRPFEPHTRHDQNNRAAIAKAEELFRNAMIKAFEPVPGQMLNRHLFEATFAAFASGELSTARFGIRNTQHDLTLLGVPDGPNFFCFAESALTFINMELSAMFWRPTLSTFVCGAALFAAHHWKPTARTWSRYESAKTTPLSSTTFTAMHKHRYDAMSPQDLAEDFGCTIALALHDEPRVQSFPAPTTPEFPNR